ncbi:hypothetical protein MSG28_010781, partial [Choristoneura fumiferana]
MKLIVVFFLITCAWTQGAVVDSSVVINQGTVVGTLNDGIYEFHGVPYADSTSGINRFKAPLPAPNFQEPFIANRKDIKCVRALGVGYEGVEDCLVANIYTPTLDSTRRLPVMVWIKGREFDRVYEHELSFKNFLDKDVIIVSLNFRESIFGFLCLGTDVAPGNAGLKDIIHGLRWVQENIANFGGNPESVTLFGHGSGAAAVDLVTLSPLSTNLVHRAITQSGTAIAPWAVTRDNLEYAIQVAEALGHTVNDINTLSNVYTRTSVAALMGIINELKLTDNSLAFAPCVEKDTLLNSEPFMTKSPYQTLNDREFAHVPFLTGFVDKEGTIRAEEAIEDDWLEKMNEAFETFLQPDLEFENEADEARIAETIKQFYFNNNPVSTTTLNEYLSYHGDTMIKVSAVREAQMRAAISTAPVYLYQFSYKGALGEPFVGPLEVDGAAHSEELAYLFHEADEAQTLLQDLTISDILIERWTNFAKTGNYLHIINNDDTAATSTFEVGMQNPHPVTMTFWNSIYDGHFKDAEGDFDLNNRLEDDLDIIVVDSNEDEDDDDDDDGEASEEEDDVVTTPAPDSASTAVGYTFCCQPYDSHACGSNKECKSADLQAT